MILPIPLGSATKLARFLLAELPERRLQLRQRRIDLVVGNDVLP